ncbi:MAG: peptidoglycan-binding domain-containing protein [Betaproteobacteria bacterium]
MTSILKPSALAMALGLALGGAAWAQSDTGSATTHDNATTSSQGTSTSSDASMSADTIRQAQQQLSDKGLYTGQVDGVMGPKTQAALKEFQQKQGMQASGKLDSSTLAALGVQAGGGTSSSPSSSMDSGTSGSAGAAPPPNGSGSTKMPGSETGRDAYPSGSTGSTPATPKQ